MIDKCKLSEFKQYYMNGEIIYLDGSDYALLRISGSMPFSIMLDGLDHVCIGTYAIINAETGNVVCTREIYDYDLKALGYKSGNIDSLIHYNGGARLSEYMNRIRWRRFNSR